MSSVKDIESAISRLAPADLQELRAWFAEFSADAWDREIEQDVEGGRLDSLHQSLSRENEHGTDIPLDEVVNVVTR